MMKRFMLVAVALYVALAMVFPAMAQDEDSPSAQALAFLVSVQNQDGGFSNGFAPESDLSATADAVVAAVAAGQDPNAFLTGDMMNPLAYLGIQVSSGNVTGAGSVAKVLTAVAAVGKDTAAFAGHDLTADLLALQEADGLFGMGAFEHCAAMVGLQNARAALPEGTVEALLALQDAEGGWGFMAGEAPDTNTTALCIQALAPTSEAGAVDAALEYLRSVQNEDGGWPYQNPSDFGTDSDTNSTALVIQALVAAGEDLAEWNNPQDWLAGMQLENGAFAYQAAFPDANLLATIGAVPALEGVPLNAWMPQVVEE
jgi:prenyltransferase beta subunit